MTDSDRPYSTYESPFDLVLFTLIRTVKMTFNEAKHADIVRQAIAVDPELRPAIVKRTITVEAGTLFIRFDATELKALRVSVGSFLELVQVSIQSIEELSL